MASFLLRFKIFNIFKSEFRVSSLAQNSVLLENWCCLHRLSVFAHFFLRVEIVDVLKTVSVQFLVVTLASGVGGYNLDKTLRHFRVEKNTRQCLSRINTSYI